MSTPRTPENFREAAEEHLKAIALTGLVEADTGLGISCAMAAGIITALLDVADAIREQTNATDLGGVRDDLANINHALGGRVR